MNTDNWQHRSKNMRCYSCMWFVPKGHGNLGRCRRRSPTMNGYPAVFQTDWCGDHKLDEERITEETDLFDPQLLKRQPDEASS